MILSDIKRYLEARKSATLGDIALHFDADPDAVQGMLEHWIRKGKVERRTIKAACGEGCNQCDPASTVVYQWLEGERRMAEQALPTPTFCRH